MTTKTFASLNELTGWCNKHINDKNLLVYWGWLENFSNWYSIADLLSDASANWFVRTDENGNKVPCSVEIFIGDENNTGKVLLISIKPKFAKKILSGEKSFEFRKRLPKETPDMMLIYASSPVQRVIGYAHVDGILTLPLDELWEKTKNGAGITHEYFQEYFARQNEGSALILSSPVRLLRPVKLEEIGVRKAPQSYMFISSEVAEKIIREEPNEHKAHISLQGCKQL